MLTVKEKKLKRRRNQSVAYTILSYKSGNPAECGILNEQYRDD